MIEGKIWDFSRNICLRGEKNQGIFVEKEMREMEV